MTRCLAEEDGGGGPLDAVVQKKTRRTRRRTTNRRQPVVAAPRLRKSLLRPEEADVVAAGDVGGHVGFPPGEEVRPSARSAGGGPGVAATVAKPTVKWTDKPKHINIGLGINIELGFFIKYMRLAIICRCSYYILSTLFETVFICNGCLIILKGEKK